MMQNGFAAWTRERRRLPTGGKAVALAIAMLAPSIVWSLALLVSYGVTSPACFPASVPRSSFLPEWAGMRPALAIFDGVCLLIALIGFALALFDWREAPRPEPTQRDHPIEPPGPGTQRALSAAAMMAAALLCLAVAINGVPLWLIPACDIS